MSVKIWCEKCQGNRHVTLISPSGYTYQDTELCPLCSGLGYVIKGCENCKIKNMCYEEIKRVIDTVDITFCTAWEEKQ